MTQGEAAEREGGREAPMRPMQRRTHTHTIDDRRGTFLEHQAARVSSGPVAHGSHGSHAPFGIVWMWVLIGWPQRVCLSNERTKLHAYTVIRPIADHKYGSARGEPIAVRIYFTTVTGCLGGAILHSSDARSRHPQLPKLYWSLSNVARSSWPNDYPARSRRPRVYS